MSDDPYRCICDPNDPFEPPDPTPRVVDGCPAHRVRAAYQRFVDQEETAACRDRYPGGTAECGLPRGHEGNHVDPTAMMRLEWPPPLSRLRPGAPVMPAPGPWAYCQGCGHLMLHHDVEDMDGTNPTCCLDGCHQRCMGTARSISGGES